MARFITAVNDYQSNNNGKTPFQNGNAAKFTQKYIDPSCDVDDSDKTNPKPDSCDAQFTDPDGNQYEWEIGVNDKSNPKGQDGGDVDHKLKVWQNASCGSEEGTTEYDSGVRNFVIFYNLEGGAVSCNDNH